MTICMLLYSFVITHHADENNEKMVARSKDAAAGVMKQERRGGGSDGYGHACEYGCCHHVFHGGCQKCCPPPLPGAPEEVKN